MRMRKLRLSLAGMLGVAVAVLPAVASSETSPTVEAVNESISSHSWSPSQVTVAAGGTITLSNPSDVAHGVEWVSGPSTPTCSSGVPVGTSVTASGKEWSGTCTFAQAGTYRFYCTVHGPEMTGTVTVNADGTTTTTMSAPPPTSTVPSSPVPGKPPAPSPSEPAGGAPIAGSASLRSTQHGGSVKGSLEVAQGGAGGRLEVDALAQSASLTSAKHSAQVRVGMFVHKSVPAGRQSFVVALDSKARRALRRHRRLALAVRITLTPIQGKSLTIVRSLVERP